MTTSRIALVTAAAAILPLMGPAAADYSKMPPITRSFDLDGRKTTITVEPSLRIQGADGVMRATIQTRVDLADVQAVLSAKINRSIKDEECGVRASTSNGFVRATGDGRLRVGVDVHGEQWACVKTKLPKTYCEDTWIKVKVLGKHIKTKGVPKCTVRWEMETAKTKVVSQSGHLEVIAWPIVTDGHISLAARTDVVELGGFLGTLIRLVGLDNLMKDLVANEIDKAIAKENLKVKLPTEVQNYNVELEKTQFIDLGGGRLGLDLTAYGEITQEQLAALISKSISR